MNIRSLGWKLNTSPSRPLRVVICHYKDDARVGHEIKLVSSKRDPALFAELKIFKTLNQKLAVGEFRPETMQWAFMKSKMASYAYA